MSHRLEKEYNGDEEHMAMADIHTMRIGAAGILSILVHRIWQEPFNRVATLIFLVPLINVCRNEVLEKVFPQ